MLFKIILSVFTLHLLFLSHHNSPVRVLSLSMPSLNISFSDLGKKLLNETKNYFSKPTTVENYTPKTVTEDSLMNVQDTSNVTSFNSSSEGAESTTDPPESSWWIVKKYKSIKRKVFGPPETTTLNPPYIAVSEKHTTVPSPIILKGEMPDTSVHHTNMPIHDIQDNTRLAGYGPSWWVILLVLTGATATVAAAALVFVALKHKKDAPDFPENLMMPQIQTLSSCPSRPPAPLPAFELTRPVPRLPATPAPSTLQVNSLYQNVTTSMTNPAQYATPTLQPSQPIVVWASGNSDHVHVYELPPRYPSIDSADVEIDTSSLTDDVFVVERVRMGNSS